MIDIIYFIVLFILVCSIKRLWDENKRLNVMRARLLQMVLKFAESHKEFETQLRSESDIEEAERVIKRYL